MIMSLQSRLWLLILRQWCSWGSLCTLLPSWSLALRCPWVGHLLGFLWCPANPPKASLKPFWSTVWFWEARCWCPCSGHMLFRFRCRWVSWTHPCPGNARLFCRRIQRITFRLGFGRVEFQWAFWWRFLYPLEGVTFQWCFKAVSFCLHESKVTCGLRANNSNHGETDFEIDIRTSDDLLNWRSELLGFRRWWVWVFPWEAVVLKSGNIRIKNG